MGKPLQNAAALPLFGAVVGRYLDAVCDELGCPEPFVAVDAGAGPGTLAASLRLQLLERAVVDPGAAGDVTASLAEGVARHVADGSPRVLGLRKVLPVP